MMSNSNDGFPPLSEQSGVCGGDGQISCEEANELIQKFLDKATDLDNGATLHEHLGDCPPCESEFVVYQRIVESLARCRPDIPTDTADRIKHYCESLCSGEVDVSQVDLDDLDVGQADIGQVDGALGEANPN